jgi:DNA-directed RNA polymerase subunit RPC12/RpoP
VIAQNGDSILSLVISSAKVEDVLRLAGVEPPANEKSNIRCPLPSHEDSSASFHIQTSGQGYKCHGCGATGGVLDLVLKLGLAENKGKAVDLLAERYRIDKGGHSTSTSMETVKPIELQVKTYPSAVEFTVEDRQALTDSLKGGRALIGSPGEAYLVGRGVDPAFAASCRVGYHPNWLGRGEAVMFLGRDPEGSLNCAQGRFLDPLAEPKTMSKGKVSLGAFVTPGAFERSQNSGPVAIVEAPIDAVLLAQHGLPAIATFGAQNHPAGLQETLTGRDVVFALDDDEAGHKAEKWYREKISVGMKTCSTLRFDGEKDPGDLWKRSPETLSSLVEEAVQQTNCQAILDYSTTVLGDASLLVATGRVSTYGEQGEHVTRDLIEKDRSRNAEPIPSKKDTNLSENSCGECGEKFTGMTAQESAEKLKSHIERNPCEKYIALAEKETHPRDENAYRCGGCGAQFTGDKADDLLRLHIKKGMEESSWLNNSAWHYPSSLTSKEEQPKKDLPPGEVFWRKLPAGESYDEKHADFLRSREVYQVSKGVYESGSVEQAREEVRLANEKAEYVYNCGGCGAKYDTRAEIDAHVALSLEKAKAQSELKPIQKLSL